MLNTGQIQIYIAQWANSIKKYAQAFYIDWAIFQNCPINVKIYATFFALENYPM